MKIWEVIERLSKNPEKTFMENGDVAYRLRIYLGKNKELIMTEGDDDSESTDFVLNSYTKKVDWVEQRKPVDFMTAINSDKRIKWSGWDYGFKSVKETLELLLSYNDNTIKNYINDNWYIED